MNELKPCPFCGGDAEIRYEPSFGVYYAHCGKCNAETGNTGLYLEREKAIGAWNGRAERTCHIVPHGYCIANGEESSCRCWSCSECSYGWHVSDYDRQYRYCPNCGARVVG